MIERMRNVMDLNGLPKKQGLYNSSWEHDNCGVGCVTSIKGEKSHTILNKALEVLKNLKHRGAVGADETTGDGSGIMVQIPHEFLKGETKKIGFELGMEGNYAVGMLFLPRFPSARVFCEGVFERVVREENQLLIGWREVPVDERECGESARATRPVVMQVFIDKNGQSDDEFERKLLIVRKRVQREILESKRQYVTNFYVCSLSNKTIVYKGLVLGYKLGLFYRDLQNSNFKTAIAIVHERYSTNTFPSWQLAQPFRYLAHNGEINTIRGNVNWMNAREGVMYSGVFGEEFEKTLPIIEPGGSDSASLDNALELFKTNNHPMERAMMMLMPQAWQQDENMDKNQKGFYEYFARLMEPWDGPATVIFSDGIKVGVTLDRNGLRPARYLITDDEVLIVASEAGAVDIESQKIVKNGLVETGNMILVDTLEKRLISDSEIKSSTSSSIDFQKWISENKLTLEDIKAPYEIKKMRRETIAFKEQIFGYTKNEINTIIKPMIENGKEPIGAMGMDLPIAILSNNPQLLFNYFKQTFAQVTNPPIDPIREKMVMSLTQYIGGHEKLLDEIEIEKTHKYIEIERPILSNYQIEDIRHLQNEFKATTIPISFQLDQKEGLRKALDALCKRAELSVKDGCNLIILSDRNCGRYDAPMPSLLALGAVHHHLIRKKLRTSVDLIVETGEARDVMHMALLIGYGAKAINPYMVHEMIRNLFEEGNLSDEIDSVEDGFENYCKAISSGILKILSRMGISTLQSYTGAQIFQIIGLNQDLVNQYFSDTPTRLSGLDLNKIAESIIARQKKAYRNKAIGIMKTEDKIGENESRLLEKEAVNRLRQASKDKDYYIYKGYAKLVNEENENVKTIRGLLDFKKRESISLEDVESVDEIVKRFTIGGMSFGSLSREAHETIALAMNSIGARSNSGEGGEDPKRYIKDGKEVSKNSAVKQVASGRFGVTANYLVNAEELQIKMAQGAKPGEGGHLPGEKVSDEIAKVRHAVPGIDLISPPPHHDIYSIEDLAQLIFDLKNINPKADINVKLVAEAGVGTVAAGVAKGFADVIMISGHDGGTGASPISSMKYVGMPWELGLAETQQTLLLNDLRSRVKLQVDGKLRSGRDVVVAALLGAEEYGFATTALISLGCILCRKCHLNKCPVGIATQDIGRRKKFRGKPEDLVSYLKFMAQETREIMAELGFKNIEDMIGRVDVLKPKSDIENIDVSSVLYMPELPSRIKMHKVFNQEHKIENVLDVSVLDKLNEAITASKKMKIECNIKNTDRSVGAMLSGKIASIYGEEGLKENTFDIEFNGSAGQSFGAFLVNGVKFKLVGEANDYVAKGLSGGKIVIVPPDNRKFIAEDNVIAGNTILYGATAGEVYINGRAGQRFGVRNSGAIAVVEGIGNHGCEYMTGGIVVVLGRVGKNFGAGMSGGVAYIYDQDGDFRKYCNNDIVEIKNLNSEEYDELKHILENHKVYTNSEKAKTILKKWDENKNCFLRVVSPVYEQKLKDI
jgi:glutamate synthase (NADPH/NADH) large chain